MRVDQIFLILIAGVFALVSHSSFAQNGAADRSAEVSRQPEPLNDIKIMAQRAALPSLKGDEKFILRESWWSGNIAPGKAKLIQVQLFRRNV